VAASLIGGVPGADPDVVAVFALIHDARRFEVPRGMSQDDDGALVADLARELQADGTLALDEAQLELLCAALVDYPPRTSDDPTIGLCWDACRLASVVIIPAEFLSTEAARAERARAPRR
jgi:hypothetical protein